MTDLHKDEAPVFQDLKPHFIDAEEQLPPRIKTTQMLVVAGGAIGPAPERGPLRAAYERRLERVGRVVGLVLGFIVCGLIVPLMASALSAAIVDLFVCPYAKTWREMLNPPALLVAIFTFLVYQAVVNVPVVLGWIDKRRARKGDL